MFCQDRHIAAIANDLRDPGHPLHQTRIDLQQACAIAGGPHDSRVQHAGQAQVMHIGRPARDLGRDVDARHCRADDPVGRGVLQGRCWRCAHVQSIPDNELAVADKPVVPGDNRAVASRELLDRQR